MGKGSQSMDRPAGKLDALISAYERHEIDTLTFCSRYEVCFNFEVSGAERQIPFYRGVFYAAAFYSPDPRERAEIPNYTSEEDIRSAIASGREMRSPEPEPEE